MQISIVAIVDIILIVSLLFALIKGWHIGLAMRLAHLIALVISCVVANLCAASLKAYVSNSWIVPLMQKNGRKLCQFDSICTKWYGISSTGNLPIIFCMRLFLRLPW